jgi:hypothetical protein
MPIVQGSSFVTATAPYPGSGTPEVARRPPRLWPWVLIMVLGLALIPPGIVVYVSKTVVPLFSHATSETPVTLTTRLSPGTYYVYQATSSAQSFVPELQPGDVTVRPTSGLAGGVVTPSISQTLGANGTLYASQVSFDVVRGGTFSIRVRSPEGVPVSVFVAPSIASTLTRNLGWLGLSGAGALLLVVGLILLIVRGVQRSRRRPPPTFAPRCANGHPASPHDRFCHVCGAPVYGAPAAAVTRQ